MRFKKIMLVTLLLLAVLIIGAVSASDDITSDDILTVSDEGDAVDAPVDDVDLEQSNIETDVVGEKEDVYIDYYVPDSVRAGDTYWDDDIEDYAIYYQCGYGASGNFSIFIDNNQVLTEELWGACGYFYLNDLNLTYGTHKFNITYGGDDNYNSFNYNGEFDYYYMKADIPDEVILGENTMKFTFAMDARGKLDLFINDTKIKTYDVYKMRNDLDDLYSYFRVDFVGLGLGMGKYNYTVKYYRGNYDNKTLNGTFEIKDYQFDVLAYGNSWGEPIEFYIDLPYGLNGDVVVLANGKTYVVSMEDNSLFIFNETVYGVNNFTFTYQDDKYPSKTINYVVNTSSIIKCADCEYFNYGADYNITLSLPSDANGNLTIYEAIYNETTYELEKGKMFKTTALINGEAVISISDWPINAYSMFIRYEGSDYAVGEVQPDIYIVPIVVRPTGVNVDCQDNLNVTVFAPPAPDDTLVIKLYNSTYKPDDEGEYHYFKEDLIGELYNGSVTGNISVRLPELEIGGYYVSVTYFNKANVIFDKTYLIRVRDIDPNWEIDFDFPDLDEDNVYVYYRPDNLPSDANGKFTLYIDDNYESSTYYDSDDGWTYDCFDWWGSYLKSGQHTWKLEYGEDTFYNSTFVNGTFNMEKSVYVNVDYLTFDIIKDGDWLNTSLIEINTLDTLNGTVVIIINGSAFTIRLFDIDRYDGYGEDIYYYICMDDLNIPWTAGNYSLDVKVYDNDENLLWEDDEGLFNLTLYEPQIATKDNVSIEIIPTICFIGFDDDIILIKADDTTGNVVIKIDDETPIIVPLTDARYEVNTQTYVFTAKSLGFGIGQHTLNVAYGDVSVTGNIILMSNIDIDMPNEDEIIFSGLNYTFNIISFRFVRGEIYNDDDLSGTVRVLIYLDGVNPTLCYEGNIDDLYYHTGPRAYVIQLNELNNIPSNLNGTYKMAVEYIGGNHASTELEGDVVFEVFNPDNFGTYIETNIDDEDKAVVTFDRILPVFEELIIDVDSDYISFTAWELDEYNWDEDDGVYKIYLNNLYMKNHANYTLSVFLLFDNGEIIELSDASVQVEYFDPNDGAQYIFITSGDFINPDFDINTGYWDVDGRVVVALANTTSFSDSDILYEAYLSDIVDYDDMDGKYHHGIFVDDYGVGLDYGNYTIVVVYYDENDDIAEYRVFNITVEEVPEIPEIFVMYSDDYDNVEYYLNSDDMIHIYQNSDNSTTVRIVVEINGEIYLNKTLDELNLQPKINDNNETYYTVGPVNFDRSIEPGYYDDVIAYYISDKFNVTSIDGNMPKDATIYGFSTISLSNDIEYTYGSNGTTTFTVTGAVVYDGDVVVEDHDEAIITIDLDVITVSGLQPGSYTLKVLPTPDEFYMPSETSVSIKVNDKIDPKLTIAVADITEGDVANIVVTTNNTFSGNVSVEIGDGVYVVGVLNGYGNKTVANLISGNYTAVAIFSETNVFKGDSKTATFKVNPKAVVLVDPKLTISIANITEGEAINIVVTTNNTFSGNVTVTIGDGIYTVSVSNGYGNKEVSALIAGTYTAVVKFSATDKFQASTKNTTFKVNPKAVILVDPKLTITVADITEGEVANIIITTNNTFSGNVTVTIGDGVYTVSVSNGYGNKTVANLIEGTYTAVAKFSETDKFTASTKNTTFSVDSSAPGTLINPKLTISIADITEGEAINIVITTNNTFSGDVTVRIGNGIYIVGITNGYGNKTVDNLIAGTYTASATFAETDKFAQSTKNTTFNVNPKAVVLVDPKLTISIADITEGESINIVISTNNTFSGNVTVRIGNGIYIVAITNGYGNKTVSNLIAGTYTASATFAETDKFAQSTKNTTFKVNSKVVIPVDPKLTISVSDITEGESAIIIITTDTGFSGNVALKIGDSVYVVDVVNGYANKTVSDLSAGKYTAVVTFSQTEKYLESTKNTTFNVDTKPVLIDPLLTISVSSITEGAKAVIAITTNSTFTGNVTVKVGTATYIVGVVNGKATKSLSGLGVGTYTATAIFDATGVFSQSQKSAIFKVNKKPDVVKLSINTVKVKKSAKKLTIKATLKINGKAVKGKKISFKFNNKPYSASTDSKGVAKITIKKAILKKLKVGKKVTYLAKYSTATAKKTVKVKK